MTLSYSLEEINQLDEAAFVNILGSVYEETPAVAKRVWQTDGSRPFLSVQDLHQKMVAVVSSMSWSEQLALIQAHPQLGANVEMAEASVREQKGAGLRQMTDAERKRIDELNQAYVDKFGFPFVMAVKGYGKKEILAAFEERLKNSREEEKRRSLDEINKIARLRLEELIVE